MSNQANRIVVLAIVAGLAGLPSPAAVLMMGGSENGGGWPDVYAVPSSAGTRYVFPHPDEISFSNAPVTTDPAEPVVAASAATSTDREVALYQFTGTGWSTPRFLTDNEVDDLEPTIVQDTDRSFHVAWWQPGRVLYAHVRPTEAGSIRIETVASEGSRPSVAVAATPLVAYQRSAASGTGTEIVVAERGDAGWVTHVVACTAFTGPAGDGDVDVHVHTRGGRVWVDWVSASGMVGYTSWDAGTGWSAAQEIPYAWGGPAGESEFWAREMARVTVRQRVLAPQP